jgi:hypothetical protein
MMKRLHERVDISTARVRTVVAATGIAALMLGASASGAARVHRPRPLKPHCRTGPRSGHHRNRKVRCRHRLPEAPPGGSPAAQPPPPAAPNINVLGSRTSSPASAPAPPSIANVAESHRSWREGRKLAHSSTTSPPIGTTFSFSLNERASVSFMFTQQVGGRKVKGKCVAPTPSNTRMPACKRVVTAGTLSFAAHAGANKVSFQGRISRSKVLKPGAYALLITATNAARQHASPRRLSFTIVT